MKRSGLVKRAGIVLALTALSATAVAQSAGPQPCTRAEIVVRYGAQGYDHWVRVHNDCEHPVRCHVSTNVNPSGETVEVAAGSVREVLTFRGSPARSFEPRLSCRVARSGGSQR